MNIDGPENPPAFDVPSLGNYYLFVLTLAEMNFIEGLSVSLTQSCLYEEETREQSDTQKWHDLRAQRLSSSKFKDVCKRRDDVESLAVEQLNKTVQTAAMKHGIHTQEEAASAYAESGDCNVFPAGIVINPSCPHLKCVNGVYKLKKNTYLLLPGHGTDFVDWLWMGRFLCLL